MSGSLPPVNLSAADLVAQPAAQFVKDGFLDPARFAALQESFLALIAPRLVQGSVLLCDDHDLSRADRQRGERCALRECADRCGIAFEPWFAYGAASHAFLCHVPAARSSSRP